jgi:hypothetical protein
MGLELRMYVLSMCIVDMSVCLACCCQILGIQGLELKCPWCISALHLETEKKKYSAAETVLSLDCQ